MMTRWLVLAATLALALAPAGAGAADYRDEIVRHVVDPCFLALARKTAPAGTDIHQFARIIKSMAPQVVEGAIAAVEPMVANDPPIEARMQSYRVALRGCIRQMLRGLRLGRRDSWGEAIGARPRVQGKILVDEVLDDSIWLWLRIPPCWAKGVERWNFSARSKPEPGWFARFSSAFSSWVGL